MKYEIVRMPQGREDLSAVLEELAPFLDAMYSQSDIERFGEINFLLDYWLFLWDTGTGFFLTKRDDDGKLLMVAVLTKYRDIWHGRDKLEIHRTALVNGDTVVGTRNKWSDRLLNFCFFHSRVRLPVLQYTR